MILHALLIGALVGVVVGSLGAGGGIVSVPILVYILGQNPHQATGLSLIIVGLTAAVWPRALAAGASRGVRERSSRSLAWRARGRERRWPRSCRLGPSCCPSALFW